MEAGECLAATRERNLARELGHGGWQRKGQPSVDGGSTAFGRREWRTEDCSFDLAQLRPGLQPEFDPDPVVIWLSTGSTPAQESQ